MCSGLGLGNALRGNTPKHARKHTKHTRKSTIHHIVKHVKIRNNMTCAGEWLRMSMYVHGGHSWVRMDAGEHNWGLRHGKEAKLTADDRCQSCVQRPHHQKTIKTQDLVRRPKGGQRSYGFSVDMVIGLKRPIKQDKRGKGEDREGANQHDYSKNPKADL